MFPFRILAFAKMGKFLQNMCIFILYGCVLHVENSLRIVHAFFMEMHQKFEYVSSVSLKCLELSQNLV